MSGKDIDAIGNNGINASGDGKGDPLLGRKSVLMGMLTSGFVIANAAHPSSADAATIKPIAVAQPAYAPRWTPSTVYLLGQQVVSSNNDVVSANVAHTSSSVYSVDTAKWTLSSTYVKRGELFIHVKDYGALNDSVCVADAVATAGSPIVTSAKGLFAASCVGKLAVLPGVMATILSRQSATQVTLSANATATATQIQFAWGTDNTAALDSAIAAAFAAGMRIVRFDSGGYLSRSLTPVTNWGLRLQGSTNTRGTRLDVAGGDWFSNGTDNGLAYDGNYYDGPQGQYFEHLNFNAVGVDTPLLNADFLTGLSMQPKYRAGCRAIVDWRGGGIRLDHVTFKGFDFWFWGIQSDINIWNDVEAWVCHDAYIGPRSDQLSIKDFYAVGCDRALDLDSNWGASFSGSTKIVGCGFGSTAAIRLRSQFARALRGVAFEHLWLETQKNQGNVECALEIGPAADSHTTANVQIGNLTILTGLSGVGENHHLRYPLRVGAADDIRILNVGIADISYIDKIVEFVGSTNPIVSVQTRGAAFGYNSLGYINTGTGKGRLLMETTEMVGSVFKAPAKVLRSGGVAGGQSVLSWTAGDVAARQATISGSDDLGNTFNAINFGNGAGPSSRKLDIQAVAGIRISDSISGISYLFDYDQASHTLKLGRPTDTVKIDGRIGFFGVTPISRPARPTDVASIIATLTALGLTS